jgi:hypothetical protein
MGTYFMEERELEASSAAVVANHTTSARRPIDPQLKSASS